MNSSLQATRYRVEGMDCAACGKKVENAVRRLPGVVEVAVGVTSETLTIRHESPVDHEAVRQAVDRLGYKTTPVEVLKEATAGPARAEPSTTWWKSRRTILTGACGAALAFAYAAAKIEPSIEEPAFIAALGIGLVPVARRAFNAARSGTLFSIESLMTIAAVGAVTIGATEEAAMVVFLFLVGEMLEGVAASRARASIQGLSDLIPKTALLQMNGQTREVMADALEVGSEVLVRPGDRIPADGVIISGASEINEAPVTGESVPKRKGPDDQVFAGTINSDAALVIRVTASSSNNTISRVIRLVEEAQESKAPVERFIERFSRYYTPGVVALAASVALLPPALGFGEWSEWIYKGLAVLLIGCPCALVISTPAAIASALAAGARRGLLLKGGVVLEQLGSLTTIAFDKTGTLTEGRPVVTDLVGAAIDQNSVLALAASLEAGSSHPLAQAVLASAKRENASVPLAEGSRALSGKGVIGKVDGKSVFLGSPQAAAELARIDDALQARIIALNDDGKTVSVLVTDGAVAGLIAMRDEPRPDAKAGLARLKALGIETIMLTGDNKRTASAIGEALSIEVRGELLPQDKMSIVAALQKEGKRVGKVGDGINDAPALAAADVGIAMGGGTDVALETADAAVLHGRVSDVANMVDLSRRAMSNIRQNVTIALGLKAVFLATTIAGVTGLWPAILADTGATVLVTANAMRLLRTSNPG